LSNTIFFITGPTAIGKSDFAIKLSNKINGEIINADSMQIYKELKILSARPSSSDIKKVQHHLYGYISGNKRFNVEKWCLDATKKIKLLHSKNITPILVGGTGLYIDTLINGITSIPTIPETIKNNSNNLFDKIGSKKFFDLVNKLDNEATKNIAQNDSQRLKRIWEVYEYTNKKFSSWKKNKNKKFLNSVDINILLFLPNRKKNYKRVNERVLKMINSGAIDEVKKLLNLQFKKTMPIMKAHGVPEIISYLDDAISFEECVKKIQVVTRNYVKRQNTWWNSSKLPILKKFDAFPDELHPKSIKLPNF
tara:strand:- start:403 stop:1326 length:924 start_codon:yes stop_codon:yes gene_type:complete